MTSKCKEERESGVSASQPAHEPPPVLEAMPKKKTWIRAVTGMVAVPGVCYRLMLSTLSAIYFGADSKPEPDAVSFMDTHVEKEIPSKEVLHSGADAPILQPSLYSPIGNDQLNTVTLYPTHSKERVFSGSEPTKPSSISLALTSRTLLDSISNPSTTTLSSPFPNTLPGTSTDLCLIPFRKSTNASNWEETDFVASLKETLKSKQYPGYYIHPHRTASSFSCTSSVSTLVQTTREPSPETNENDGSPPYLCTDGLSKNSSHRLVSSSHLISSNASPGSLFPDSQSKNCSAKTELETSLVSDWLLQENSLDSALLARPPSQNLSLSEEAGLSKHSAKKNPKFHLPKSNIMPLKRVSSAPSLNTYRPRSPE